MADVSKGPYRTLSVPNGPFGTWVDATKAPFAARKRALRGARCREGRVRDITDVPRVPFGALSLDPPMVLSAVLVVRQVRPGQTRSAGAGRAALGAHPRDGMQRKARSLHQRCSERRVRCGHRSESAFRCIGHVANAPFTARGGAVRASGDAGYKIIGGIHRGNHRWIRVERPE